MLYNQLSALGNKLEMVNSIPFLWEGCKSICSEDKLKNLIFKQGYHKEHIHNTSLSIYKDIEWV